MKLLKGDPSFLVYGVLLLLYPRRIFIPGNKYSPRSTFSDDVVDMDRGSTDGLKDLTLPRDDREALPSAFDLVFTAYSRVTQTKLN